MSERAQMIGSGVGLILLAAGHFFLHATRRRNSLSQRLIAYVNRGSIFKSDSALLIMAIGFLALGLFIIAAGWIG